MIRRPYDIAGLNRSIDDQIAEQLALENVPNPGATGPTLNGLPFVEDQEAAQHRFTGHVGTTEADAGGDIIDVNAVPSMARQSVDNPTDLLNPYLDDDSAAPNVRPQFANQPASNPFQTTADEDKDLERAARADRRSKIAQGVLGALGGIMSIAGAGGMAGAAGAGLTRGIQQLPTNREEQLRGRIEQRQARDLRQQQYSDQRADRAMQEDLRRRSAESNIALDNARLESMRADQAQRDLENQAAANDAAGMRRTIQAFANSTNANTQAGQELRSLVDSAEFQGMNSDTLREVFGRYVSLAATRHGGLLTRGGGPATTQREEVVNPDGSVSVRTVRVGGAPANPAATRSGPRTRVTPRAATPDATTQAQPTAASVAGEPLSTDEEQFAQVVIDGMRGRGLDPSTDAGRRHLRGELWAYRNAPSSAARSDVVNDARARLATAAESEAGGLPPGVSSQELRSIPTDAVHRRAAGDAIERFIARLNGYQQRNPAALRAVLVGAGNQDGVMAAALDATSIRIRADLQAQINNILSDLAGANVTPNEMERNLRAQGVGALSSNVGDVIAQLRNRQREQDDIVQGHLSRVSERTRRYWLTGQ